MVFQGLKVKKVQKNVKGFWGIHFPGTFCENKAFSQPVVEKRALS